jgi:hypothetical protein
MGFLCLGFLCLVVISCLVTSDTMKEVTITLSDILLPTFTLAKENLKEGSALIIALLR